MVVWGRKSIFTLALAATLLAGASIVSYLWRALVPRPDQKLEVTHVTFAKLAELQDRPKYVELPGTLYNGLRPELARLLAERQINALINRLREGLASNPSKKFVLGEFAKTMTEFEPIDTEDREQLLRYLEDIMDILSIASSDGLLNRWMYGPILGPPADKTPQAETGAVIIIWAPLRTSESGTL
jgi:Domain of unknown function (DUF4844)